MTSTPGTIRLSVPVTPEVYAIFRRLAQASGRSMAASMSQWLLDTRQAADLMAENLERLRESPGEMVAKVKLHISAVEDAAQMAIDEATRRAEESEFEDGRPRGRRPPGAHAAPRKPLTPPSSNTGGKVVAGRKSRRGD